MNSASGNAGLSRQMPRSILIASSLSLPLVVGSLAFHDFREIFDDGCAVAGVDSDVADEFHC